MVTVTLEDVANRAGVSKKTVSRVLNNEPSVAFDTFRKVQQAMAELDYVPNTFARRLSSGRAKNIGIVLGLQLFVPYTSKLVEGAVIEGNAQGYGISLFPMQESGVEHVVQAFRGKQVDGFILDTRASMLPELRKTMITHQIPHLVVNPNSKRSYPRASFIGIDDMQGTKNGTEYLLALGHREIGFVTVATELYYHKRRIEGFKKALQQAGVALRPELVLGTDSSQTFEIGYTCGLELIQKHPDVTAIFAVTDNHAMGVMQAIWKLGLKVPDDISVIGFDDNYYAPMTAPPLTTIHQPTASMGREAVRTLIHMLDNPAQKPVEILLPTRLEVRGSCAAPRQQAIALPAFEIG